MLYKSIRWRIQAWHTLLLVCLVTGMLGAFYGYERGERFRVIDNQLQALLTPLLPKVMPVGGPGFDGGPAPGGPDRGPGPEGGPDRGPDRRPDSGNQTGFAEFENGPFYYAAWSPRHDLISQSPTASAVPMPSRAESGSGQFLRNRGEFRELVNFGPNESCVVVGTSMAQTARELQRLALTLVGVGLGLTLFGLAGGWWVAGHALRPIGEISATARQIAGGNRAKRIDIRETESELGQLAEVLNWTFDRQDSALEQQVRFTADASHELRTPVSVILTQAQLALARERDGQEYRETLKICQRAAERMRTLVNSLLELARVDAGEFKLTLEECDLAAVGAESLELVAPLAREKNAVLRNSIEPARIKGDSARIGQVLVNLLYNAIQHNPDGVEVRLSVQSRGNEAVLRVADNGAGIPAEALPHVFERFYRADKSRGGTKNGSGLGLAISRAIVQAHGGTIRAESQAGQGAVFTVSLPLAG
jgi:two-component system, OmpR family, sensor kinase